MGISRCSSNFRCRQNDWIVELSLAGFREERTGFPLEESANVSLAADIAADELSAPAYRADPGLCLSEGPELVRPFATRRVQLMSSQFTDKHHDLLGAAAEREDRLLPIPSQLRGGAAQKVAAKFVAAGLAKEVKAKAGAPVWRRDTETEQAYALKLTAPAQRRSRPT